jgi:hypothetical protein
MNTIITNYITYDQAYYYADLKRLPRLSRDIPGYASEAPADRGLLTFRQISRDYALPANAVPTPSSLSNRGSQPCRG